MFRYISINSCSGNGNLKLGSIVWPSQSITRYTGKDSLRAVSRNTGSVDHGACSIWKYGELTPVTQQRFATHSVDIVAEDMAFVNTCLERGIMVSTGRLK